MLKDIKTLKEISEQTGISIDTLYYRLRWLEEGEEYRKLGTGQSIILTLEGAEKITKEAKKVLREKYEREL